MKRIADLMRGREQPVRPPLNAATLAEMLQTEVFDKEDAAVYLDIGKFAVQMATFRNTLPYVQYGGLRLFAIGDLDDYAKTRGVGRHSRLRRKAHYEIVARQVIRVEPSL